MPENLKRALFRLLGPEGRRDGERTGKATTGTFTTRDGSTITFRRLTGAEHLWVTSAIQDAGELEGSTEGSQNIEALVRLEEAMHTIVRRACLEPRFAAQPSDDAAWPGDLDMRDLTRLSKAILKHSALTRREADA